MKILTTGTSSGLGRHVYEGLGGTAISRSTAHDELESIRSSGVDVIVHCAFNSRIAIDSETLFGYLKDNLFLTEELVSIPHRKFVYISTVDVYPKDGKRHFENETIDLDSVDSLYGIVKLMSEAVIRGRSNNYLILRASALLGKYSRKNSLMRMLEDPECALSLSGESRMNYILYDDVLDFIRMSIDQDLSGIYNMTSEKSIVLSELAMMLGKKIRFGGYIYDVGDIDNSRICSVSSVFKKTSKEVIEQFIKEKS